MTSTKRPHESVEAEDVKKARLDVPAEDLQPTVRLRSAESGEGELTVQFRNTPVAALRSLRDREALAQLLSKETAEANGSTDAWLRQPDTAWIQQIVSELPTNSPHRRRLRQQWHRVQAATSKEFFTRWAHTSDFASLAIELWLEGKSLEDVLERCKTLGQLNGEAKMAPGYLLQGELPDALATTEDLLFESVLPMVRKLSGKEASVYTVCHHNCFEQEQRMSMPVGDLKPHDRQGSLNTTWDYAKKISRSGVELLDTYHDCVSESLQPCGDVELNKLMYLIWKLPHYVTSYHQDTHVPPHFTLYNQVSGVSLFHFLPVLLGLFVTHVGRHQGPEELKKVLERLDEMKIGSLVVLRPGQVAFISPMGSHGVWVPSVQLNSALPSFHVSVIRAAEVFLSLRREMDRKPVMEKLKQRLRRDNWKDIMEVSKEELEKFQIYKEVQRSLRDRLKLSAEDWAWMTRLYLRETKLEEDDASSSTSSS